MKIPYNCLHVQGSTLFAARGGKIHSFSLTHNSYIATWKHPDLDTFIAAGGLQIDHAGKDCDDPDDSVMVDEAEQPPSKRQKVTEDAQDDKDDSTKPKRNRGKDERKPKPNPVPDRPVIIQLATTPSGSHVVAVSGNDKAVWVFSHDGSGHLTELSKRIMPKRPSAIQVTLELEIIVADKFGDVYCIPLLKSTAPYTPPARPSVSKPFTKPAASVLTVHSKGNRAALAAQQREMENPTNATSAAAGSQRAEGPDFEHTLLLGHVSMLTSLLIGRDRQNRKYILTSDRDEHIRVSRYMPQSHVIHGYCLGHAEFVGDMAIADSREETLVSGGGDDELFVWNWVTGELLCKTNILKSVKEVVPEATKVAVSRVFSNSYVSETDIETHIIVICEGVPALFTWQLLKDTNTLTKPGIIQLPGKPLDLAITTNRVVVALHVAEDASGEAARALHIIDLELEDGRLAVEEIEPVQDDEPEKEELEMSYKDIRSLFYTVEHLRKQQASAPEDAPEDGEGKGDGERQQVDEAAAAAEE
ncbi:hypothetical protein PWT90_03688 [Aphanocladium album]|nr:hypothetical protein PWT90_03688 [Aphanocladium album]